MAECDRNMPDSITERQNEKGSVKDIMKNRLPKYGIAGLIIIALALSACGQQSVQPIDVQSLSIPIAEAENSVDEPGSEKDPVTGDLSAPSVVQSPEDNIPEADYEEQSSSLSQPEYIGSWKVTDYRYPSTPCGLSQLEVDALIGSELTYASKSFTCNQRVIESEEVGYEFAFYDSLEEYEQDFRVSVSDWFAGGDVGMIKSGYLTIMEDIFGNNFIFMDEQPDKMMINYYGVLFLAVRQQPLAGSTADSPRDSAYKEVLNNLLYDYQLPLGQEAEKIPVTVYFAIQDVDGDGREELLIDYQGSIMATIQEMVYDFDESKGELYREIWDFPDIQFYAGGYARSDMSHNHTRSDFWPYNLYRYNSGTDRYELAFVVTAWDKALVETDAAGNPFPDAVDVSGTGRVFMIEDGGTGQVLGPMDTADYEKWYSDTLGKYAENDTAVVWQLLTEENLKNL